MGFKVDVDRILVNIKNEVTQTPQFLLFSATVPRWIKDMANTYLNKEASEEEFTQFRDEV